MPPGGRYRFRYEGHFSFREFVLRYMQCAWNEALDEGIALHTTDQIERAHQCLNSGSEDFS